MSDEEKEFYKDMGLDIKEKRLSLGIAQKEMAYDLGVNPSYVADLERGKKTISAYKLCTVFTYLDLKQRKKQSKH